MQARFPLPANSDAAPLMGELPSVGPDLLAAVRQVVPCQLALPRHYEPGYAYPLILFFHEDGANERQLLDWWPHLGEQNYLGLAIRAPLPAAIPLPGRYRWSARRRPLYQQIELLLGELGQDWNVHPQRIILMGQGTGALLALRIWLRYRRSFAGAIAIHPPADWPARLPPLETVELGGRLLFSGIDLTPPDVTVALAGLGEAGIGVNLLQSRELTLASMGADINRWIMAGISSAIV